MAEELWHELGNKNFISLEKWPEADEKKINEKLEQEEKIVENIIDDTKNILKIIKEKGKEAKKVYLYVIPKEIDFYKKGKEQIVKNLNLEVEIYAVNDKNKYDPENKSSKARLGKPAIYIV